MRGDAILIERGDQYHWEGDFRVLAVCAPGWTKEQCKMVDNTRG